MKHTLLNASLAAGILCIASGATAEVTLINTFEIDGAHVDTVIDSWRNARDFLSDEPGYRSTTLHRALDPGARFVLVNVATWESAEAFARASERMQKAGVFPRLEGVTVTPALYEPVKLEVKR